MSTTTTQYKILIGGELADAASGETMEVIAPATGETIAEVPRCGAEDVDRAVEAAHRRPRRSGWRRRRRSARSSSSSSPT
jgi:acyl-CoA reductase-like NAD-dependent aldehyde dehydrogenase